MTAPHFRVRLVEARLCHLLAQLPLFQIQFPSPLPLFRSKLWTKRVHLIYTAAPPQQHPTTVAIHQTEGCVCVCTGACRHSWKWHWTFFSNSRVAFDWRAAEHCCGCSLRFSAGMSPPVFLCCLWFLLTHTVQLLHCYNTTCNFNDLFKFTSQMKFFVSSYMWRASVCCLLIRTHTTHTRKKAISR